MISRIHLILPNAYKLMRFDRNINRNRDVKFLECDYLLVQRCVKLTLAFKTRIAMKVQWALPYNTALEAKCTWCSTMSHFKNTLRLNYILHIPHSLAHSFLTCSFYYLAK